MIKNLLIKFYEWRINVLSSDWFYFERRMHSCSKDSERYNLYDKAMDVSNELRDNYKLKINELMLKKYKEVYVNPKYDPKKSQSKGVKLGFDSALAVVIAGVLMSILKPTFAGIISNDQLVEIVNVISCTIASALIMAVKGWYSNRKKHKRLPCKPKY